VIDPVAGVRVARRIPAVPKRKVIRIDSSDFRKRLRVSAEDVISRRKRIVVD